ncbi:MAG TPA: hypothetical protein VL172_11610, partial [Kofleriaceae bacterium]|nr:hypothetical protein [Kofleriaceae bacterium]
KRVMKIRVDENDPERALDEIGRGYEELLGMPPGLADRIDARTMAHMLRRPDKMRAAAALSVEEGHAYKALRDPLHAVARYRRAHELYLEARAIDPRDGDDAALLELSRLAQLHLDRVDAAEPQE